MERSVPKPEMSIEGLYREIKLDPAGLAERFTPAADLFVLAHLGIPEVKGGGKLVSANRWSC